MEKKSHLKRLETPEITIIKEEANCIDIVDKKTNKTMRYIFDQQTGIVTEKTISNDKVVRKFIVYLTFEKDQIINPDILRSAIKTYSLMKNFNYKDHCFHFEYLDSNAS